MTLPTVLNRVRLRLAVLLASLVAIAGVASAGESLPRPLTHNTALAYAIEHNPQLRRVTQQVAEQEGVLMEASARLLPAVTAGVSYGYTGKSLFEDFPGFADFPKPDSNAWQLEVSFRQVVYSGGANEGRIRSAKARADAARAIVAAAVNRVVFQVEQDFLGVLLAREQIKVREEALRVLETEWEQAKIRHTAGTGSRFDVLRAEVAVANARPALIRAQNAYHSKQDALRADLGASPEAGNEAPSELDVQGELLVAPVVLGLHEALATALSLRPELRASEAQRIAAHEERSVARAGRKPVVSFGADYQVRKASYPASWRETLDGFSVGARIDYPIFDGHATDARVRQSAAREEQAVAAGDELRLRIDLEVREAHRSLAEAAQLLESAHKIIAEAEESLRLARARLSSGTATQLDLLSAQTALTEARSNLSHAQHDYALNAARLRLATATSPGR